MNAIPIASYRLQFTPEFTFAHASAVVPYLEKLGISHIYASPIFKPRAGSTHGYDVADPTRINPELGGEAGFEACAAEAASRGIGWVQDIVPNHMVFSKENPWLMDVFENGQASRFAGYFDITWDHLYDSLRNRVLAPVLGEFYGECLETGEIKLAYDRKGLHIAYYDHRFPVRVESYYEVFGGNNLDRLREERRARSRDLIKFIGALHTLKNVSGSDIERSEQIIFAKEVLWELYEARGPIRAYIESVLAEFNAYPNRGLLDTLLARQHFRLSFWKVACEELDYRRFFTINDLISLRVEDETVFSHAHGTLFALMKRGLIQGLRIDHIDGLRDPLHYLERIREQAGDCYLVVEKILDRKEHLPTWPVHGTSGYDALNIINGFFCDTRNGRRFDRIFSRFTGIKTPFHELAIEKKRLIIGKYMAGDIDNLAHKLKTISSRDRRGADITLYGLRRAFVEFLTFFPVYRTYIDRNGLRPADRAYIKQALAAAMKRNPGLRYELEFIGTFMLLKLDEAASKEARDQWIDFCMRVQQFTGPLMAKGVEDTVLYIYNRLVSQNDVGADPSTFGVRLQELHSFFVSRARNQPLAMNTTATHDTKRGEDVRARLNVLSEIPMEWLSTVKQWRTLNAPLRSSHDDAPDPNDEYLFYQTALGTIPYDAKEHVPWIERLAAYMVKAVREAKVHTEWLKPDSAYEDAVIAFVKNAMSDTPDNRFLSSLREFAGRISFYGMLNSLSQITLKCTAPGVPDLYQGADLWDLSMVDPDNRRPVDFEERAKKLDEIINRFTADPAGCWREMTSSWRDGRIKLLCTYYLLAARKRFADVFSGSSYTPLRSRGAFGRHCAAFLRRRHNHAVVVIVPRFFTAICPSDRLPLGKDIWNDTHIELKHEISNEWRNELTGESVEAPESRIFLADALRHAPVAVLSFEHGQVSG
jgi:(1->4)-alpha-D-glucan 1-alpha-D-glucosylmutase